MRQIRHRALNRPTALASAGGGLAILGTIATGGATHAAEAPTPPILVDQTPFSVIADYFARLPEIKRAALDSQPSWVSPIVTTTARLEQNLRYEQTEQVNAQGVQTNNFDNGKGIRVITSDRTEVQFNPPPIQTRAAPSVANGTGDWQFTSLRYRLASANAESGDYVVTAYSNFQAPSGAAAFTNHAWIFTPSLAAGKGFGAFDVQANVSVQVPGSRRATIGTALLANIAFQYHVAEYFWPQVEFNATHWFGGQRADLTQVYVTPGILFGRFSLTPTNNLTFGIGYQKAIAPSKTILKPALTPTYDHALILASRLSF